MAVALTLLIVGVLALPLWPFLRVHLQAVAVLDLVANQPVPAYLRWTVRHRVAVDDLTFPASTGPVRARLYTPVDRPDAPPLMVLHGVHYLGIDEPRLIAFATAMSACGLRVLTPELPDIKDYHIGANSIATIGDSAAWFSHAAGNQPAGVLGLSFSGGLALLAAADPQFQRDIKFVFAVGSQDQMQRVAAYYRTGEDERPNGTEELLPPHEYGPLVLEYENLADFVPAADIAPIRAVLRAHLYENAPGEKSTLAALNPRQKAEADALMNINLPSTRAMLARAEAKHVAEMAGVSPHGHLGKLTVPVYLLHGEGDNIIPAAETLWMQSELPTTTLKAALISPVLSHLDLDGASPGMLDNLRLVHFFALILQAAESKYPERDNA
jgi:pimeloyl-ACP methyl ester carboxylesterase